MPLSAHCTAELRGVQYCTASKCYHTVPCSSALYCGASATRVYSTVWLRPFVSAGGTGGCVSVPRASAQILDPRLPNAHALQRETPVAVHKGKRDVGTMLEFVAKHMASGGVRLSANA